MPILGRWIIANVGLGVQVRSMTGSQAEAPEGITPVVPCDDAAVERVAVHLAEAYLSRFDAAPGEAWDGLDETTRAEMREAARDMFYVAGEGS